MTGRGKPPDFEPLASSDPVPGDPDQVAALGRRYADTAAEIATQAANLRKLATAAPGGWVGQAGDVFHSKASDLSGRISKAHDRYATTGQALTAAAGPMADAQQRAWAAVWAAKTAQQQMAANAPAPQPPLGSPPPPPPTAAEKAAAQQKAGNYSSAQSSYSTASTNFATAVSDYQNAAGKAAGKISTAIDHDGLKDSWWDRNFGWIKTVFEIIGVVVLVIAIVAIILLLPGLGAALVAMGIAEDLAAATAMIGTLSTILDGTAFALTALTAAFDGVAWQTGKESATAFIVDLASLATFGMGAAASKIVGGLAKGAESVGEAVAAGRAGRASMPMLMGWVYSLGAHGAPGVADFLRVGDRLSTALDAASGARTALADAVKEAEPKTVTLLWTKAEKVAAGLAKLDEISSKVPNVIRIEARAAAGRGVAGINGAVQWTGFGVSNGYSVYQDVVPSGDQAAVSAAVAQFRQALSHVP